MSIHELVHPWQIANVDLIALACDAPTDSNSYGNERVVAGVPFRVFGHEEQAAIVDSWYGAYLDKGLGSPKRRAIRASATSSTTSA